MTHILNVTEDVSNSFEGSSHLTYMRCPIKDQPEAATDMAARFDECVDFINSARETNGRVLVHCRAGVSRSATVAVGYLMSQACSGLPAGPERSSRAARAIRNSVRAGARPKVSRLAPPTLTTSDSGLGSGSPNLRWG